MTFAARPGRPDAAGLAVTQERMRAAFADKAAVITGAGSGIGRGIALGLAQCGLNVVIADLDIEQAESVAAEAQAAGVGGIAVRVDVADPGSVENLARETYESFRDVGILVNNAGVALSPFRSFWETSDADWKWVMGVNFWGVVNGMRTFLPRMLGASGRRHIVNTCSLSMFRDRPGNSSYVTSKAAVLGVSEAAAQELADKGIDVTILIPGRVTSRLFDSERLRPETEQSARRTLETLEGPPAMTEQENPTKTPEEVGAMVLRGILARQLYVLTHEPPRDGMMDRLTRILAAAPSQLP